MDGLRVSLLCLLLLCGNTYAQDSKFEPGTFESYSDSGLYNIFYTHRECEQNFYHCSLNNFQLWMELGQCKPSTPTLECSDFQDGAGSGLLWKPVSENTGNPVILFPGEWWEEIEEIQIQNSAGETLTKAKPRTCCPNGGRAHYDLTVRASSLPKNIVVLVKFSDGERCFNVADPEKRYD